MSPWKQPTTPDMCSNDFCKRTSPGDGPTCRWHFRDLGTAELPRIAKLCNACKINFDQGKYCSFCVQIYRLKDPDKFDKKEWTKCENPNCKGWVHAECAKSAGNSRCPACTKDPHGPGAGRKRRSPDKSSSGRGSSEMSSSPTETKSRIRYEHTLEVEGVGNDSSRKSLRRAVSAHFMGTLTLKEEDVIDAFLFLAQGGQMTEPKPSTARRKPHFRRQ